MAQTKAGTAKSKNARKTKSKILASAGKSRSVTPLSLERLTAAAAKAEAVAASAKESLRAAKADLKKARKSSKAAKKAAKLARREVEAAAETALRSASPRRPTARRAAAKPGAQVKSSKPAPVVRRAGSAKSAPAARHAGPAAAAARAVIRRMSSIETVGGDVRRDATRAAPAPGAKPEVGAGTRPPAVSPALESPPVAH